MTLALMGPIDPVTPQRLQNMRERSREEVADGSNVAVSRSEETGASANRRRPAGLGHQLHVAAEP
jgi:hypothetical protein